MLFTQLSFPHSDCFLYTVLSEIRYRGLTVYVYTKLTRRMLSSYIIIILTWISIWSSFSSNARFLIISFLRSSLCRNSSTWSLVCTCWRRRSSWDSLHLLVRERDVTVPVVGFSSLLRSSRNGLLPIHHGVKTILQFTLCNGPQPYPNLALYSTQYCGQGSLTHSLTQYRDLLWARRSGENLSRRNIFCTRPDRPWGPPNLLYMGYRTSFPGVRRLGCGINPTHLAEVKKE
jgi:hypothetical protein